MALSYEFSIGSVRTKENSLFTNSDLEHMLGYKSETELVRYLNDKGFGEGKSVDEVILNHKKNMWIYLKSVAPDFEIFNPFFYQNDVHNLKVVLKGTMSGSKYDSLLAKPCTISIDLLKNAVETRKFSVLPEWLAKPADKAYELLTHTGDARISDAVIDKAVMQKMLEAGKISGSDFLDSYFRTVVFYSNIKIALRASRTGTSKEYLLEALCEVEESRLTAVIDAAVKGYNRLTDTLSKFSEYDCNKAIEAYKSSPAEFERFVDNKLMAMTKESCKRSGEGAEPLLGYYLGCEAEIKAVNIIACGIQTKSDESTIRERLREIYG